MDWKSLLLGLVVVLFVFGVFALSGAFDQDDSGITGHAVAGNTVGSGNGVGGDGTDDSKTTTQCADDMDNDNDGLTDLDDPDCYGAEDDTESGSSGSGSDDKKTPPEDYCGDGTCDADEDCDACPDDCGECEEPEEEEIACFTDADCEDGDPCNPDECVFPGHKNSYCTDEVLTLLTSTDDDGCCPEGARVRLDMDCEPVCGNGWCEPGENERLCKEDCEGIGESGDSGDGGGQSKPRGDGPSET